MALTGLVKGITGALVGSGVSSIVNGIVENNVTSSGTLDKICIFAGKTGISMLLSDITVKHTNAKIDVVAAWCTKLMKSKG